MARIKVVAVIVFFVLRGCAPPERCEIKQLSADKASALAARLANDECEKFYKRRPFSPDAYKPVLRGNRWRWGEMHPAGICGYSTEVSFKTDGSDAKVEVFFSSDRLSPRPRPDGPEDAPRQLLPPEIIERKPRWPR